MRALILISMATILTACGPTIWQRQYAECYTDSCRADVVQRQARYRAMVMSEPMPMGPSPMDVFNANRSAYQMPAYAMPTPSPIPVQALDTFAPKPYEPQTWGQTRCAPAIAPVAWDTPVTERNALIPAGC